VTVRGGHQSESAKAKIAIASRLEWCDPTKRAARCQKIREKRGKIGARPDLYENEEWLRDLYLVNLYSIERIAGEA
jgi:hypothetical protein